MPGRGLSGGKDGGMKSRAAIAGLLVGGLLLTAAPSSAGSSMQRRARVAARYIVSQQEPSGAIPTFSPIGGTADAVLALVSVGGGAPAIQDALDYLQAEQADIDTVGERAKVIMALIAFGESPRSFAGRDLVDEITDVQLPNGRYGEETAVFDHALATLALGAADEPVADAARWLARAQCDDGGWQRDRPAQPTENRHCFTGQMGDAFTKSDTNTTALAVQALEQTARREKLTGNPFGFFRRIRDPQKNGWGYSWGFRLTDTNSTALVHQAYFARGRDLPDGARRALIRLQHRLCGDKGGAFSFAWEETENGYKRTGPDVGATVAAVPALMRRPLPLAPVDSFDPLPKRTPCN